MKNVAKKGVTSLSFSNYKKNWIVSGGGDGIVKVFDFGTQSCLFGNETHEDFHTDYVKKVSFYGEGDNLVLSGALDKFVKLWDCRMGKIVAKLDFGFEVVDFASGDGQRHGIG